MKEGEMGNMDEHITRRIERDNAETGSREKIDPPEPGSGYIDKNEAEATAYAEKPFRDVARNEEYLEKAPEGTKEFLDWVASEEGEKALEQYRKSAGGEREKVREILKRQALEGIRPNLGHAIPFLKKEYGFEEVDDAGIKVALEGMAEVMARIVGSEVDIILAEDIASEDRQKKLKKLVAVFGSAATNSFYGEEFDVGGHSWPPTQARAIFARRLGVGDGDPLSRDVIRETIDRSGIEDGDVEKREKIAARKYLDLIADVRAEKVANNLPDDVKTRRRKYLDDGMQEYGYIWDEDGKQYIEIP